MRRPLRITLLSIAGLGLLLIAGEVAASFTRAGNAAIFVADNELFLVRKPDQHGYTLGNAIWNACHINKHGLRGEDLPESRPAEERWVLCVGDSFTFGGGVDDDEAWPQQLQALVGPPESSGVRVLNGGANGWDTRWQRRYIEARGLPDLHPDIVVIGWNWNDLHVDVKADTGPQYVLHFLEAKGSWLSIFSGWPVLRETHLYRWFHTRTLGSLRTPTDAELERSFAEYRRIIAAVAIEPELRHADARTRRFGDSAPDSAFWESTDTPVWKMVRAEMTRIKQACDEHGAVLVVAMFPEPTWDGPGTFPGVGRLAAILDSLGVAWVDVQPDFLDRGPRGALAHRREELWQRYDPVHPVPEGQRIMAENVATALRGRELIPATQH